MRKAFLAISFLILATIFSIGYFHPAILLSLVLFIPLIALGLYDYLQNKHTIRRNYPLIGRMRYLMEELRPGVRQYFIESDTDGKPFNRLQRSQVYARSKKETDTTPFGTQQDVYQAGYEWVNHSIRAINPHTLDENPKVSIGNVQCSQPYDASIFNISAMSFGALSQNAILALNNGAKIGGFYHNTGEGGLSPYHLQPGGDVVWNVGTGYFSCRNADGTFSATEFAKRAVLPSVKMIEIKFSQGAKPGHGGILPKEKVTQEIADIRLVPMGNDIVSPPAHTAFTTPIEFVHFAQQLRTLSGGKPVGMKICIGNKSEFLGICKAMVQEKIYLDFITIDGGEGGTGAAPMEFSNSVGMPLRDAVAFVFDALTGFDLKQHTKIICSGKITSGFDIIKSLSLGADLCNSARGMMFALGCIQALECNTNTCPTGVATQDLDLQKGLVIDDKKTRVANFHATTVKSAVEMMAAAGISHPNDVGRNVVHRRINATEIATYEETYPELPIGCLLTASTVPANLQKDWARASVEKF